MQNCPGTYSEYAYDAASFRLTNLLTLKANGITKLQDFDYYDDVVGNITTIVDNVADTTWFDNTVVTPDRTYTYDAIGRMTQATGREDASYYATANDLSLPTRRGVTNPGTGVMRSFTRDYTYDKVGNITQVAQSTPGAVNDWTGNYT